MNLMLITSRITDHDLDLRALRKPKEQKLTDLIIEKRRIILESYCQKIHGKDYKLLSLVTG